MPSETAAITWRAWCEHDGCDWEETTVAMNAERAQNQSSRKMFAHGMATGHHETRHQEADDAE